MNKSAGSIFFSAIGQLIKSVWKLLLLIAYGSAKIVETIAGFVSKIAEKMLN